jgi:hypothetical protein
MDDIPLAGTTETEAGGASCVVFVDVLECIVGAHCIESDSRCVRRTTVDDLHPGAEMSGRLGFRSELQQPFATKRCEAHWTQISPPELLDYRMTVGTCTC